MKLACLNCLISYECWHVFFGLSRDQAGPSPPALGLIGSDDERGGPAPKDDDDEVEEDEADYLAYGTKRPFKVHPSQVSSRVIADRDLCVCAVDARSRHNQARTYFGIRKRSAEDKIKDLGFHRVKGLFPSDHPWIVKKYFTRQHLVLFTPHVLLYAACMCISGRGVCQRRTTTWWTASWWPTTRARWA
jgi:hypothetical protein